ncbi:unnamed protein product [Mytilus edulis]|uniref:Integrase core domain-containing protein n=1 Tax=Mytilus edulis TaxID=6550 RepID=A0A8S3T2P5_MYTED|nr:unnamed protein product [Mytilus edulis]
MHMKSLDQGLIVDQETVRQLMLILDPIGVMQRKRRRLNRRMYFNTGPNYTWHIDSNDKLKPYGIVINGCSDGFSRLIVWCKPQGNGKAASVTNHFIKAIQCRSGCPTIVRTDMGVENGIVQAMQKFLRRNHNDSRSGNNSVICGDSRLNQRIESWWNILRKQSLQFWIDLFQQMIQDGIFQATFLTKLGTLLLFEIIQADLDSVVSVWNKHRIRKSANTPLPSGKPAVLYSLPHLYGYEENCVMQTQ